MTQFWQQVLPSTPGNHPYLLQSYRGLGTGKKFFRETFNRLNVLAERQALFLVMAMIETAMLEPAISRTKSRKEPDSCSVFNFTEDLLRSIGYRGANIHEFDSPIHFPELVALMNMGLDQLGAVEFLRFVCADRYAFANPTSIDASNNYLSAVATGLRVIDGDAKLLRDDRRIEMRVRRQ